MNADHLAKEADRLKNDEIFNKALDDIRTEAMGQLVHVDADDKTLITRLQQRVQVADEIRNVLDRYILAADTTQENAGSFA